MKLSMIKVSRFALRVLNGLCCILVFLMAGSEAFCEGHPKIDSTLGWGSISDRARTLGWLGRIWQFAPMGVICDNDALTFAHMPKGKVMPKIAAKQLEALINTCRKLDDPRTPTWTTEAVSDKSTEATKPDEKGACLRRFLQAPKIPTCIPS